MIKQPTLKEDDLDKSSYKKICHKLILCDKNDEIVNLSCSVLAGVAREVCFLKAKQINYDQSKVGILTK